MEDKVEISLRDSLLLARDFFKAGLLEDAYKLYLTLASIEPGNWDVVHNVAYTLAALKRYDEAILWYDKAMQIAVSQMNIVTLNKSQALGEIGCSGEAIHMLQNGLLRAQPDHINGLYNLGVLLMQEERFDEAQSVLDRAMLIDPDAAQGNAKFCRGFANLVLGNYIDGFRDFEDRLKDNIKGGPGQGEELRPEHVLPRKVGEYGHTGRPHVAGRTVLVLSEMGRGDVIQFGRFIPLLLERGAKVVLGTDRGIGSLFDQYPVQQFDINNDPLPETDYWCHMMGLAHVFQITVDTVPPPLSIVYEPDLLREWRQRIPDDGTLNVGLCWAGSPTSRYDEHRSIPLAQLEPLLDLVDEERVRFYSLQQNVRESDKEAADYFGADLIHIGERFTDFRQTAHAMKCLDLVITVDTSVAHMAGTVGVPTWILTTRFRTYWLWLKGRVDTPWYPSVNLIRQPVHGNWPSAVAVARERLLGLLSAT